MSATAVESGTDLLQAIREATPRHQRAALNELLRLCREPSVTAGNPFFVRDADGLMTALVVPLKEPFDPNAHKREPG